MRTRASISLATIFLGVSFATTATAADLESIAECAAEREAAQYAGIDNYAVDLSMMNQTITQYFERVGVTGPDGESYEVFRMVPPDEISRRQGQTAGLDAAGLEAYARGLEETGAAMEREMNKSGMPAAMLQANGPLPGEEPWASPNPRVMLGSGAMFLRAAAAAQDGDDLVMEGNEGLAEVFRNAQLIGDGDVEGRSAHVIKSEGLSFSETSDSQEFTINAITVWLDSESCLPLKFRMDGTATADGEVRELFIEKHDKDYQQVDGSNLVMPHLQVMRMGGVLTPEEEAQLEEARVQLAEFEKELAAMPANQRSMMESMMGSRIDMMRNMVNGGGIEFPMIIKNVRVNQGIEGLLKN